MLLPLTSYLSKKINILCCFDDMCGQFIRGSLESLVFLTVMNAVKVMLNEMMYEIGLSRLCSYNAGKLLTEMPKSC